MVVAFEEFRVDAARRVLWRGDQPIHLQAKTFELLLLFVNSPGRLIEKAEIMQALWPGTFVVESNITQNVFLLRKALSGSGDSRRYVVTIPGRGYKFAATPRRLPAPEASSGAPVLPDAAWGEAGNGPIAVLPFQMLDPVPSCQALGLRLADALITSLGSIKGVKVLSTASVERFAGREENAVAAASELGAALILDGRLQCVGSRLRATLQLVRVSDGAVVWARKLEGSPRSLLDLQDELSAEAVRTLELYGLLGKRLPVAKPPGLNPEAHESYLMGRFFLNHRTVPALRQAILCFEKAVELERDFAPAHVGIADGYALLAYYSEFPAAESYSRAKSAVDRALGIDSTLGEGYATLGMLKTDYERDWDGAEHAYQKAISLSPHYAFAHDWRAEYLTATGRHEEAIQEVRVARELEPNSLVISRDLGFHLYMAGQLDEAVRQLHKTLEMDPGFAPAHWSVALAYEAKGMYDQAIGELRLAIENGACKPRMLAEIACCCALAGNRKKARELARQVESCLGESGVSPYSLAVLSTALGDLDRALEWIAQALEQPASDVVYLKVDPRLERLRATPAFSSLLARARLAR